MALPKLKTDVAVGKNGVPHKDLIGAVAVGARDEELYASLLTDSRLENKLQKRRKAIYRKIGRCSLSSVVKIC